MHYVYAMLLFQLPKREIIRRLRLRLLKAGIFEFDSDMTEGQTNYFLRDIVELKKRQQTGMLSNRKRKSEDLEDGDGGKGVDEDADKDLKRMKANIDELWEEDQILVFIRGC
ncbi:hypothetical protein Ancab_026849 [Ancistrocladus abbreviatus]